MKKYLTGLFAASLWISSNLNAAPIHFQYSTQQNIDTQAGFEDIVFDVEYDPASAFVSDTYLGGSTYRIGGAVTINGQSANLSFIEMNVNEHPYKVQEGLTIKFVIDPAPYNNEPTSSPLYRTTDDDQNDGLDFQVDFNEFIISFAAKDRSFLDGESLPSDLLFLNAAPASSLSVQGLYSQLTVLSFYDIDGNWAATTSTSPASSAASVPAPATLWLFGPAMVGLIGISRRKKLLAAV